MTLEDKTTKYIRDHKWSWKPVAIVVGVLGIVVFPLIILWDNRSELAGAYADVLDLYRGNIK